MIYGLIFLEHITTTSQKQRDAIVDFAKQHHFKIDNFIFYNTKPDITLFKTGDSVIVFTWNCLCARGAVLNTVIRHFIKNKINLYSVTSNYCIDESKGFNRLDYAFGLYEDIRFNFLSERSICGAKRRIANGHAPGRPNGAKNKHHVLDGKEKMILKMYSNGISMYAIAKKLKVSAPTIKRFLSKNN